MRFSDDNFKRFGPKIRGLTENAKVAAAQQRLGRLMLERQLFERREQALLDSLAASDKVDLDEAMRMLVAGREHDRKLCREALTEYIWLRRQIEPSFVPATRDWRLPVVRLLDNDLAECITVARPSGVQFLHSYGTEDWGGVTLVGLGFEFAPAGGITSLHYEVEQYGPSFLTELEASWGLIVPDAALCGLEISAVMSVDGFVDNKATRNVAIAPAVHIKQFRSNLPLDQVDASADPLLSNIWGDGVAGGVTFGAGGYVDSTYGLHSIPSIRAQVKCAYAYPGHSARVLVQPGDRLVITCQLTVAVDQYSYVLLGDPRPQPTLPRYGGVRFSEPMVTFYGPPA